MGWHLKKRSDDVTQETYPLIPGGPWVSADLLSGIYAFMNDQNGNGIFLKTFVSCLPCPVAHLLHEHTMLKWSGGHFNQALDSFMFLKFVQDSFRGLLLG